MSEKKKVITVNAITGTRFVGTLLLPLIVSLFGSLGIAIYIGALWLSDFVDGLLARRWEVSTIFGASLDAFCDKVFGVATLIYLYNFYPIMLFSIFSELTIFGVNWHYGKKGADVKTSIIGKIKAGILYFSTVAALFSTLSLTSSLAAIIPTLMLLTSSFQVVTLSDYIIKNKKYIKKHKPKTDVSKLGFVKTIKEICRLLKDPKIYSPAYYKEHQNVPLLDMLLHKKEENQSNETEELPKIKNKQSNMDEEEYNFNIQQKNELKNVYCLNYNEIAKLETFAKNHKLAPNLIMSYLSKYIDTVNSKDYPTVSEMENFIIEEEQQVIKSKGFKEMS